MDLVGLQRGVIIVMNPQTGEILAMVSLPTYDDNLFATGISQTDYQALINDPRPAADQLRDQRAVPARLDVQAGHRRRRAAGRPDQADDASSIPKPYLADRPVQVLGLEPHAASGPLNIYDGFGHSSDTFFYQLAGMLGIDRLGYWAKQWGFGEKTGIDLPNEARGIVPTNDWKQSVFDQPDLSRARSTRPASARATTPSRHSSCSTPTARWPTAARSTSRRSCAASSRPDGSVVRDFKPDAHPPARHRPAGARGDAPRRAPSADHSPHVQPR